MLPLCHIRPHHNSLSYLAVGPQLWPGPAPDPCCCGGWRRGDTSGWGGGGTRWTWARRCRRWCWWRRGCGGGSRTSWLCCLSSAPSTPPCTSSPSTSPTAQVPRHPRCNVKVKHVGMCVPTPAIDGGMYLVSEYLANSTPDEQISQRPSPRVSISPTSTYTSARRAEWYSLT